MCCSRSPICRLLPGCTALRSATSSAVTWSVLTTLASAAGAQAASARHSNNGPQTAQSRLHHDKVREHSLCLWHTAGDAAHHPASRFGMRCRDLARPGGRAVAAAAGAGERRAHPFCHAAADGGGAAGRTARRAAAVRHLDGRHAGAGSRAPGAAAGQGAGAAGQQRPARHAGADPPAQRRHRAVRAGAHARGAAGQRGLRLRPGATPRRCRRPTWR